MKKKIASSFGLTLIASGLGFGFNFFIAKVLGAEIYGQISYYLSFVQILVLLISFNYAALYMGNKITQGDTNTFSLFVSVESLAFVIVALPAWYVIDRFTDSYEITALILFSAYFSTLAILVGLDYNADKQVAKSILYSTVIPRAILVAVFSMVIFAGFADARSYLYVYLMSFVTVAGYFLVRYRPVWYIKKAFFTRAWKFYLLGIIGTSVTYIAQIAQKEYGSYEELASLSIALLLIAGLSLVGGILIKFALPKIHEAWKERDIAQLEKIYTTHTFLSSMVNLPILIFLLFYIEYISGFIGEGYRSLPIVFTILSVGYFFDLMTGITGTILRATEHEHLEIYNEIFRFVVGIGLIILLRHQSYGIAYAVSASMVIYNLFKFFQVYRLFKIKPMQLDHFAVLVVSMFAVALVCYTATSMAQGWLGFLIGIMVLAVYYLLSFSVMKKRVDLGVYR